jgi:hypothetical protein
MLYSGDSKVGKKMFHGKFTVMTDFYNNANTNANT